MAKLTKLQRSNKAHLRLCQKYENSKPLSVDERYKFEFLANYHDDCLRRQNLTGKVLSKEQRKKNYNSLKRSWGL